MSEGLLQRLAVLLCERESVSAVRTALQIASEAGLPLAARMLDTATRAAWAPEDMLVLYSVEGVLDDGDNRVLCLL